jgi:hypothetical protein
VGAKNLVLLPCSHTKRPDSGHLPAIERYDGPLYRVLRKFLRESAWPEDLSVAVLSARYGLVGGLAPIESYDQRMDASRAAQIVPQSRLTLSRWSEHHATAQILLGQAYLPAVDLRHMAHLGIRSTIAPGPIGRKLNALRRVLNECRSEKRRLVPSNYPERPLYLLPDWDDMLDANFDFRADSFSEPRKSARTQVHSSQALGDERICDGVVISLAQHFGTNPKLDFIHLVDGTEKAG